MTLFTHRHVELLKSGACDKLNKLLHRLQTADLDESSELVQSDRDELRRQTQREAALHFPRGRKKRKAPRCLSECHKLGLDLATVGTFPAELDANCRPEVAPDTSDLQPMSFAAEKQNSPQPNFHYQLTDNKLIFTQRLLSSLTLKFKSYFCPTISLVRDPVAFLRSGGRLPP